MKIKYRRLFSEIAKNSQVRRKETITSILHKSIKSPCVRLKAFCHAAISVATMMLATKNCQQHKPSARSVINIDESVVGKTPVKRYAHGVAQIERLNPY